MNGLTRFVVGSAGVVAVIATSVVAAHGAPAGIGYTAQAVGDSVVLTIDSGSLDTADDRLEIRDDAGELRAALPLGYHLDNRRWPIDARIEGDTVTLTPIRNPARATPAPGTTDPLKNVVLDPKSDGFKRSLSNFTAVVGVGTVVGSLLGTITGATIGCVLGGLLVGGAATVPTLGVLTIPGFLGGCLVTAVPAAALGGVVGTIAFGVPALIIGGIMLGGDIAAPPAG